MEDEYEKFYEGSSTKISEIKDKIDKHVDTHFEGDETRGLIIQRAKEAEIKRKHIVESGYDVKINRIDYYALFIVIVSGLVGYYIGYPYGTGYLIITTLVCLSSLYFSDYNCLCECLSTCLSVLCVCLVCLDFNLMLYDLVFVCCLLLTLLCH